MTKRIKLKRINDAVNFKAINQYGKSILMDGSENIGGIGNGVRPMDTLLMGLAGCSAIDLVIFLKKMKQNLIDLDIDVVGEIKQMDGWTEFSNIKMTFNVWGEIKEKKLQKALSLSIEKYCSVAKILEKSATIEYDYILNPEKQKD